MTDAYVNIEGEAGAISGAAAAIADIDAVTAVHVVTGPYDVVAQLDLADPDDLPTVVADEIHAVDGVADTETYVAFEP